MSTKCEKTAVKLVQIMKQEISLLEAFQAKEEELSEVLKRSDWGLLSELMDDMSRLADWIDTTEKSRHEVYALLCRHSDAEPTIPFYQAIVDLPDELRAECAELYRSLKFAIVKIKGITLSIDSHVRSISETMHSVLNELFPYRKGKLYSRCGTAKTAETEPLVVNHHL